MKVNVQARRDYSGWRVDGYFEWLVNLIDCDLMKNHRMLIRDLHEIEFIPILARDNNRCRDGIALRYRFIEEENLSKWEVGDFRAVEEGCSVLEMMIAMADRFANDTIGVEFREPFEWFWDMLINVGLIEETDEAYDSRDVFDTVDRMMYRQYQRNGSGGLFPLKHPKTDQRNVELWYQLCSWFNENYWKEVQDI